MTKWEYSTIPLLTHATKAILDQWGADGWELVQVIPGPTGSENLVAYLKRPIEEAPAVQNCRAVSARRQSNTTRPWLARALTARGLRPRLY